ncbi:uncharacterized protein LOC134283587, partial [Saccostrea cucullata]|uniref:uncharacterized protein LOC134283587 n=1 Tax=Saccostrea cuccullata TaxID=36930 RepID=UPI002ED3E9F9
MYLMKIGKWKIPKNIIKTSFNQKSIEYIFEKEMSNDFKKGLWKDLELKTRYAYTAPKLKGHSKDKKDEKLNVNTSGLFGLIFFALLKRKCYEGAKQLIETGCVRIQHLLVGCVILQEAADDWQTSQLQRGQLLRMKT